MKKLRLILGDQLNSEHSWFQETDENTVYLLAEMRQETDYVKHHIQKVVAFFLSMRNFWKFHFTGASTTPFSFLLVRYL